MNWQYVITCIPFVIGMVLFIVYRNCVKDQDQNRNNRMKQIGIILMSISLGLALWGLASTVYVSAKMCPHDFRGCNTYRDRRVLFKPEEYPQLQNIVRQCQTCFEWCKDRLKLIDENKMSRKDLRSLIEECETIKGIKEQAERELYRLEKNLRKTLPQFYRAATGKTGQDPVYWDPLPK